MTPDVFASAGNLAKYSWHNPHLARMSKEPEEEGDADSHPAW